MSLSHYMCTHCGAWHQYFAAPPACFVCSDVRNALPPDGFEFLSARSVRELTRSGNLRTTWSYVAPGILCFTNAPALGLGSCGYVIERDDGNVGFEATGFYSDEALAFLASRGGLRTLSCSHPHGMGALWQLQVAFGSEVVVHRDAVQFTKAFDVDCVFDDTFTLADGLMLHHVGGHYEGQAVLHDERAHALFCGDTMKFEHDGTTMIGLSCHKAFHKRIPLSHAELRKYRGVIGALSFGQAFSPFDHGPNVSTEDAVQLFDAQLARGRTTTTVVPFEQPRQR